MTLEGCVVRMADTISYIGRDIEDALRLGLIKRSEIPPKCVKILGNTNGKIVFNLVTDVILNSFQKPAISFSPEVSDALAALKAFNLERIYHNPEIKAHLRHIKKCFEVLFEKYLNDLAKGNLDSVIFNNFLKNMSGQYLTSHCHAEIVRDFIAGMTDRYFLQQCSDNTTTPKVLHN
jgi:dGTPase